MKPKTKQNKGELLKAITGSGQPERLSLAEKREKIYDIFYNNLRMLIATETISMTELARKIGVESGTRIANLSYGRATPKMEEIMMFAKHFNCSIDSIIYKRAKITFD